MSELAKGQHGVVSRRQLLAAGVSGSAMRRMTASGWLDPIHAGVYLVAGGSLTREAAWMAAVLAGGESALLRHRSAGKLWNRAASHAASRGSRCSLPHPGHPPSRTLLDLAAVLSHRRLSRALEAADRHGLLEIPELTQVCEASSGRKGVTRLCSLLARYRPLPDTRSELERRFLHLCREAGLPPPAINVPVAGVEVDFLWPGARVVVELDGFAFHRDRAAFERDRARDAKLQLAGYRVLRVTYTRLVEEADAVIAEVSALLRLREASASLP